MATQPPFLALSLARVGALLLATAAVSPLAANRLLAQAPGTLPDPVSIPTELPADAVLRLDGSSSMVLANEDLRDRFLKRFPNASVEMNASRTDAALRALIDGELDIVAAGRPLTAVERSQGLVEVPIEREKIAVIVGPENSFDGSLSFEQFARMFRGEIRNWAEVGGAPARIRVVDRPNYSDTRIALSRYAAFDGASFSTGSTADPVDDDDTEAVVDALGADGISYAVASQVLGRSDVRVLAMHQTLPDDPRYPYSQPRAYVYNAEDPTPAALAFVGFFVNLPEQTNAAVAATKATAPTATPSPKATPPIATPVPTTTLESTATSEQDTALVPSAGTTTETASSGRPWWLLGIPVLGGLLWWLLKGKSKPIAPPVAAPVVADPPVAASVDNVVIAPVLNPKAAEPVRDVAAVVSKTGSIQTITVHSRHNAVLLRGDQMQYLQDQVAATYSLDPGSYILRIKAGTFNYGNDTQPGEPWVLLWIYGGRVSNLKTGVWVNGTWSTLNGYADTLSLEVDEPAQLCAFFIDTFPENNTNAIRLSVIRL
ncbi:MULTISPECIES: substrate-binding domain-containing protein [Cyanophyceae]|uniref:substrate-binding domain-containing protein n=1 Tax=Cyanophyceae TaxID=3028117 RepID=UPI0016899452|nr:MULTISPECIES: substrate-binding domain-containing protein [Cyanophyceae]MBD1915438.1 substrate-binding domain-containing protein [Phormidium sp. FACHB-77]MBD2028509.1 substrate-binding domain-containing protein [Phormidium sp. FACHB-322]MBD2051049.1 substrate-binding domain-containing protein [Leptolyngbya sp. FACHB-60]